MGALYKGIGKYLGMDLLPGNGGDPASSAFIRIKFLAAKKALGKYDFVFCHIKGADLLAENGDYLGKKNFIETIDNNLPILDNLKSTLLVITSDHGTSCLKKQHTASFVPFLIYSSETKTTGNKIASVFTEKECQKGKKVESLKMIPLIVKMACEAKH